MRQQDVHDELRARLHEAAEAHEPDRARILARVERGMAPQAARPGHRATLPAVFGWVRVVSATAAVAAVLGVGGYAVASAVKDTHTEKTVAVSPTPSGTPDAATPAPSRSAAPPAHTPSKSASPKASSAPSSSPTASATPTAPVAKGEQDGPLRSDGSVNPHSNDFWAQSDVTLKVSQQLTALTVQLKVAQTGGVSNTGAWRSLPETDFTQTVAEQDGFLVYTWTLKPDAKVPVGQWVFAGQYNHESGGRDAKDDSYTITGSADGKQYAVTGDFATHTTTDGHS
ncbi:hypothetical protein ACFV2H_17215 [Streptomyces sp. NPDC059629]|uniref:hypothetical protein n=1 Tax=Streptomyces sp. NPDC059629 TaxID=3346889 RepID=UPI0036CFD1F5